MQFFRLDFQKVFSIAAFFAVCGVIYTLQQAAEPSALPIAPTFLTAALQPSYNKAADMIGTTTRQYLDLLSLKEKMLQTQIENQTLKAQLLVMEEVRSENTRLKEIFKLHEAHPQFEFVVAKVTAKDLFTDHYSLTISKGSEDGIEKLSGVITGDGVVGYVVDVQDHSARLLLVTDRLISIDSTIQRTRGRGIISGQSKSESLLKFIDRPQDMAAGDVVVTSDDQRMFPIGYPVGNIVRVQVSPFGVGHTAIVKPSVDPKKLDEVIVLKAKK